MEIDFWTSASVTHAKQLKDGKWEVTVRRNDKDRIFTVKHLIFAIGVGGGTPNMPKIEGMVSALRLPFESLFMRLISVGQIQGPDLAFYAARQGA